MSMQYLVFFLTVALGLVLVWKNVTGKIPYDWSFAAGLGFLPFAIVASLVVPDYLFLVPLAMIFLVLVTAVWAFDAGSAPVARFAGACLAADNPARRRNVKRMGGGLFWLVVLMWTITAADLALSEGFGVFDVLLYPVMLFLAICAIRICNRVLRSLDEYPEDGL